MSSENSGTQSTNPNQAIIGLIPVEVGCNLYAMLHEIPPFWLVSGIRGSCGKVRYANSCPNISSSFAIFTSAMLRTMPRILIKCGSKPLLHTASRTRGTTILRTLVSLCSLLCSLLLSHPITSCYPKYPNFRGIQLRYTIIPVSFERNDAAKVSHHCCL